MGAARAYQFLTSCFFFSARSASSPPRTPRYSLSARLRALRASAVGSLLRHCGAGGRFGAFAMSHAVLNMKREMRAIFVSESLSTVSEYTW